MTRGRPGVGPAESLAANGASFTGLVMPAPTVPPVPGVVLPVPVGDELQAARPAVAASRTTARAVRLLQTWRAAPGLSGIDVSDHALGKIPGWRSEYHHGYCCR